MQVYGLVWFLHAIVLQELSDQVNSLNYFLRLHFMIVNLSVNYLTIKYYYTYGFKTTLQPSVLVSQS
jgi:hypothetical protein